MANREKLIDWYYSNFYTKVHNNGNSLGKANEAFHKSLESVRDNQYYEITLELGAGSLQHFKYVNHNFDKYIATDIRDLDAVSKNYLGALQKVDPRIEFKVLDALNLEIPGGSVDRIIATCLLMHLPEPDLAINEWQRVLKPNGVIDILVPCDPGLLIHLFRKFISERSAKKQGVSKEVYRIVNAIEHISSFTRCVTLTKFALAESNKLTIEYHPFRLLRSWNLNGYAIFRIQNVSINE